MKRSMLAMLVIASPLVAECFHGGGGAAASIWLWPLIIGALIIGIGAIAIIWAGPK